MNLIRIMKMQNGSDKMNALVIGAGKEAVHGIQQAKQLGMYVIAFDGNDKAEGLKYADEAYVIDIRKPENIFSIIDSKQLDRNNLIVIPVPIGRYLISSAAVNEKYGLIGPKIETTEICTDKWIFHQTLRKLGLRNINCVLLKAGNRVSMQEMIPAIIKPRYGAGSRMVQKISTKEEWVLLKKQMPYSEDFIIEESVDGNEYGIDGIVLNGVFHLVLIRKKINTPPPYRQCVGYIATNMSNDRKLQKECSVFMNKLVSVIKLEDGIVHADVIFNDDGFFVIEMSSRPSGHRLYNIFTPLVTGIDMVHEYLSYVFKGKINLNCREFSSVFMIRYFDIESEIKKVPDKEYMLKKYPILEYECNLKKGDTIKIIDGHSLMDRGYFIIEGKDEDEVCALADNILCEFMEEENG